MKNSVYLVLLAAAFSFVSCSKDDDDKGPSKAKILTSQSWVLTSAIVKVDAYPMPYNVYDDMASCEQDNITKFAEGGAYSVEEGATKCEPSDPDVYSTGTWEISGNGKKITITENGMEVEGDIVELTSSKFITKGKMDYGGFSGTATLEYEAL